VVLVRGFCLFYSAVRETKVGWLLSRYRVSVGWRGRYSDVKGGVWCVVAGVGSLCDVTVVCGVL
jgi:hypothetical protein